MTYLRHPGGITLASSSEFRSERNSGAVLASFANPADPVVRYLSPSAPSSPLVLNVLYREWTGESMKPGTTDQIKVGRVTNNHDLESEGRAEKLSGKVHKKIAHIEKILE